MSNLTLIEDGRSHALTATREVREESGETALRISSDEIEATLGWTLKPEGMCRGEFCIPTAGTPGLATNAGIDLIALANLLARPLVFDDEEGVASIGSPAREQAAILATGMAPDFALPDLAGQNHTLSHYRGKKVLLIAYASW